jgi:hypothetical protein
MHEIQGKLNIKRHFFMTSVNGSHDKIQETIIIISGT